jgi:hypothetical protein
MTDCADGVHCSATQGAKSQAHHRLLQRLLTGGPAVSEITPTRSTSVAPNGEVEGPRAHAGWRRGRTISRRLRRHYRASRTRQRLGGAVVKSTAPPQSAQATGQMPRYSLRRTRSPRPCHNASCVCNSHRVAGGTIRGQAQTRSFLLEPEGSCPR